MTQKLIIELSCLFCLVFVKAPDVKAILICLKGVIVWRFLMQRVSVCLENFLD